MSDSFIMLKCPSCGGKLDVYDEMERFACNFCGTEMAVQRKGGTVALKILAEAMRGVQISTDKATAEMMMARIVKEKDGLKIKLTDLNRSFETVLYCIGGAFVLVASPLYWKRTGWIWVTLACAVPLCFAVGYFYKKYLANSRKVQSEIQAKHDEIARIKKDNDAV